MHGAILGESSKTRSNRNLCNLVTLAGVPMQRKNDLDVEYAIKSSDLDIWEVCSVKEKL